MAAISTYASFPVPRFPDQPSSPKIHPLEHLSLLDGSTITSTPTVDLNVVGISDLAGDNADCIAGFTHPDCAGFHIAPSTPTKERTRRATMPESLNHRTHEVSSPYPQNTANCN